MIERESHSGFATRRRLLGSIVVLGITTMLQTGIAQQPATTQAQPQQTTLLKPADLGTLFPAQVFFRGQSAGVQVRNSGGLRFANGMLMMAALVDTSGYSSGIQQRYQGYLITEVPLSIGEGKLPAGAYGFGFIANDRLVVMDVGDHELLNVPTQHDQNLHRATPLQLIVTPQGGSYRLYAGRSFVSIARAK